jgi:hypothetical protein
MSIQLQEQAVAIASLRASADVQFKRMAYMQAELDLLPAARKRRATVRALLQPTALQSGSNGNGRTS